MKFPIPMGSLTLAMMLASTGAKALAETPTETVARQFREYSLHESTGYGERLLDDVELPKSSIDGVEKLLSAMRADGSWADIDYASKARSAWPPSMHLTRTLALVVRGRGGATPAAFKAQCLAAAHRALAYWIPRDFRCPNWWHNEIGVPKVLGNIALLLNQDLTEDERDYITRTVLPRAKVGGMTGQNRVWLAANGLMLAALQADEGLMRRAAEVIHEELRTGLGEGIQPDWSYHQHGPQQQFGNYGMAYAVEMSRWITVLRGTPWEFPEAKVAQLRNYLLEGLNWVIWRGMMDVSACGRQLFPKSSWSKAGVVRGVMRTMGVVDTNCADEYGAFVSRNQPAAVNDLTGNRMFWRSDYLIHRRTHWMTSLKMSSSRVIGGETVNRENLSGLHLADGATFFYRSGHEYDDIFPVWNWRMIPGGTSQLGEASLRWPEPYLKAEAEFVGGVSDGANACAAMDFHRAGLRARKSWFFRDDVMVCLGSNIHATGAQPVVTTINQCLLKSSVTVQRADQRESMHGSNQNLTGADWVEHDGLRYTPLGGEAWLASAAGRSGNWRQVFDSPATPKADLTRDVFTLWIAHGNQPAGAAYAYAVSPAEDPDLPPLRILANTDLLQAVKIGVGQSEWIGAVFWSAGSAMLDGIKITVSAPCLMIVDAAQVWVSDPTQKLASLRVTLNKHAAMIHLPSAGDAGKSVGVGRLR
jgi:chondroitin AC lyase